KAFVDTLHNDLDTYVFCALSLAVCGTHVADTKITPEQVRRRHRNRDEVTPIDGDARTLFGAGLGAAFAQPLAKTKIPKRQRLKRARLAGVIGADKNYGLP